MHRYVLHAPSPGLVAHRSTSEIPDACAAAEACTHAYRVACTLLPLHTALSRIPLVGVQSGCHAASHSLSNQVPGVAACPLHSTLAD